MRKEPPSTHADPLRASERQRSQRNHREHADTSADATGSTVVGSGVDLRLLAQRAEDRGRSAGSTQAFAFHSHSTLHAFRTPAARPRVVLQDVSAAASHSSKKQATITTTITSSSSNRSNKTPWRQVDESIDHIYEDASTDFVQLRLLHRSRGEQSTRQKRIARERVVTAASALRERESRERERHTELQRKKQQVQQLSEAIRRRNKKRSAHHSESVEVGELRGGVKASSIADQEAAEPKRKPPVPRQRGRRRVQAAHSRNSRLRESTDAILAQIAPSRSQSRREPLLPDTRSVSASPAQTDEQRAAPPPNVSPSVSSSILLGASSELEVRGSQQSNGEESHEVSSPARPLSEPHETMAAPAAPSVPLAGDGEDHEQQQPQQQHRRRAPRRSAHQRIGREEETTVKPTDDEPSGKEREERRELARAFIEMQKQSRRLARAREKQRQESAKLLRTAKLEVRWSAHVDVCQRVVLMVNTL